MNGSVRDITAAVAAGDADAFSQFYQHWFDFVLAEAQGICGGHFADEQRCLDMVQDSMMRVIHHMKPIDDEIGLQRWLQAVVRSVCYDHFRREKRRRRREAAHASAMPTIHNQPDLDERLAWLQSQLATLGPDESHLLTLRFRLNWTLEQIGRSLGLKPGAVDSRISRSLKSLRRHAQEDFHDR